MVEISDSSSMSIGVLCVCVLCLLFLRGMVRLSKVMELFLFFSSFVFLEVVEESECVDDFDVVVFLSEVFGVMRFKVVECLDFFVCLGVMVDVVVLV